MLPGIRSACALCHGTSSVIDRVSYKRLPFARSLLSFNFSFLMHTRPSFVWVYSIQLSAFIIPPFSICIHIRFPFIYLPAVPLFIALTHLSLFQSSFHISHISVTFPRL